MLRSVPVGQAPWGVVRSRETRLLRGCCCNGAAAAAGAAARRSGLALRQRLVPHLAAGVFWPGVAEGDWRGVRKWPPGGAHRAARVEEADGLAAIRTSPRRWTRRPAAPAAAGLQRRAGGDQPPARRAHPADPPLRPPPARPGGTRARAGGRTAHRAGRGAGGTDATAFFAAKSYYRSERTLRYRLRGAGAAGGAARRLCAGDGGALPRISARWVPAGPPGRGAASASPAPGAAPRVGSPAASQPSMPVAVPQRPAASPRRPRASRRSSSSSNRRGSRTPPAVSRRPSVARSSPMSEPGRRAPGPARRDRPRAARGCRDAEPRARPPERAGRQPFRPARRREHVDPDRRVPVERRAASAVWMVTPAGHRVRHRRAVILHSVALRRGRQRRPAKRGQRAPLHGVAGRPSASSSGTPYSCRMPIIPAWWLADDRVDAAAPFRAPARARPW